MWLRWVLGAGHSFCQGVSWAGSSPSMELSPLHLESSTPGVLADSRGCSQRPELPAGTCLPVLFQALPQHGSSFLRGQLDDLLLQSADTKSYMV